MTRVRPFRQDDIPQVAELTWRFLYEQKSTPPAALEYYLQQVFLLAPYADPNLPSFVCLDVSGRLVGFLGALTRQMSSKWGPLRVAFGSNFIVHPGSRMSPAGLQLAKSFLCGDQDLSLSDTANETSQLIWKGFGGTAVPISDRHWSRPLIPGSYALRAASRLGKNRLSGTLAACCRPLCRFADSVASGVWLIKGRACTLRSIPFDEDILLEFLTRSCKGKPIQPVYDRYSLHWLLEFMRNTNARGVLRKVALRNEAGSAVGCYVYYVKRGEIGEVVYLGAEDAHFDQVFDHLLHDAAKSGVIGLHGKIESGIAHKLSKRLYFSYCGRDPLLVYSRESDLTRIVQEGGLSLTRLDGEWCFKFGFDLAFSGGVQSAPVISGPGPFVLEVRASRP